MSRIDLGHTRHVAGDLAGAEAIYRAMIGDGEDVISAANNLFVLLRSQGRASELARLYLEVEAEITTEHAAWADRLCRVLLSNGEYEAGWQWYESRRRLARDRVVAPTLSIPEWRGEPVRSLLVWREQGLGDEIMFARFLSQAALRGMEVTYLCNGALARLFADLPVKVVPLSGAVSLPPSQAWCLLGSLPLKLGAPFSPPPPLAVKATPRRSGRIGVMTAGGPAHINDANRSLPADLGRELLALPGAVSLRPEDTGARDFQDTADIVAGLDLVITVDTSVAHLAGSVRTPTWVLLPSVGQDWRWVRGREDSPWYPSARLFRQAAAGDWREVVDRVRAALSDEGLG